MSRTLRGRCAGDAGQVVPLMALVLATAIGALVLLGALGGLVLDRAQARSAADAAALAGALEGRPAATTVAAANGGVLEQFRVVDQGTVEVTVRVDAARATARAEATQVRLPAPPR